MKAIHIAVVVEETAKQKGQIIASTKTPNGKYTGMNLEEFTEATKYISAFTIKIETKYE